MGIGEMVAGFVSDPFVMMILGAVGALFQKVMDKNSENETPISLFKHIIDNPYRTGISIIGLLVGYSVLVQLGQLTTLNALGIGYFSHSILETFASRMSVKKLGTMANPTIDKPPKE